MKIMAVDLGDARTGLAVCDRTEFLASPIGVIHERDLNKLVVQVSVAVDEYQVSHVVVGYPKNMDGTTGERAQKCERFAQRLRNVVTVPVELWDERRTTVTAHEILNEADIRGQKRKDMVDEVAATIILESYLAYRRNQKEKAKEESK
ncbi:Holliday junction resolvase RuvX [Zongyangia sp. HA2173]|uniref:Holliday junction resolvase RuvX n=1 Tax=Zongyangia sp. HA2173 TaxID=3133035 RepID=UPI00174DE400